MISPSLPIPDGIDVADLERIGIAVVSTAARLIVDERPGDLGVELTKSSRTDVVTVMDQAAQDLIVAQLALARPDDAVQGEERGGRPGTSGITWVIDPIDGTTNYLYDLPAYSVSVAAVVGDPGQWGAWRPIAGAVADPCGHEIFHARAGGGASRTSLTDPGSPSRSLRVSPESDLDFALIGTGFGYAASRRAQQAHLLVELLPRVRDIRRMGSAALDLCRVACGQLDGYYETGLNAWDLAAGWLICTEAGAVVRGRTGDSGPSDELCWASGPALAGKFGPLIQAATERHLQA